MEDTWDQNFRVKVFPDTMISWDLRSAHHIQGSQVCVWVGPSAWNANFVCPSVNFEGEMGGISYTNVCVDCGSCYDGLHFISFGYSDTCIGYSVTESCVGFGSRDGAPPHISAPTGRCQRRSWRHASRVPSRDHVTTAAMMNCPKCRQNAANSEASL